MDNVEKLKVMVQQVYGIPLRYGNQCKGLSDSIIDHTNEYVSYQTLRRLFGYIKTENVISTHTLNILARYCGYHHFDDYLLHLNREENCVTDYIELIYSINIRKELDDNLNNIYRNVATNFYKNLESFIPYSTFLAKSKNGQIYFFERFPFFDYINNCSYRKAFGEYNLYKNTVSSNLFFASFVLFGDFLMGEKKLLAPEIPDKNLCDLHPFLQARFWCNKLLIGKENIAVIIKKIYSLIKEIEKLHFDTIIIHYTKFIICEYLIVVDEFKAALNILGNVSYNNEYELPVGWNVVGQYEVLYLVQCICLYKCGEKEQALKNFETININIFHFAHSKYYTIWYLILKSRLSGLTELEQQEKETLINETKFFKMKEIEKNF